MDDTRISRLSKRHCDVLRGVAALKKTKQIAADLGIAPGTVDGYIAEAVRILGATDRGDAARMLGRHERMQGDIASSDTPPSGTPIPATHAPTTDTPSFDPARPDMPPGQSGGQSPWVAEPASSMPGRPQPVAEPEAFSPMEARSTRPFSIAGLLPVRRPGQRSNDLPVVARLLWIPAIAVILAVGFGMLASGLKVLADLIERLSHLSG